MMRLLRILTLLLGIGVVCSARAEIVVVVNPNNPIESFSRRELVDLYMGRTQSFSDGSMALRLDLPPDSQVRGDFYRGLVNKSVAEVNAYWAKLLFTGRASPPQVMDNSQSVLKAVRENKNAVGYIDSKDVDSSVKVVAHVN
jgi:ABC-type phosphate transport system substrate-binding protein